MTVAGITVSVTRAEFDAAIDAVQFSLNAKSASGLIVQAVGPPLMTTVCGPLLTQVSVSQFDNVGVTASLNVTARLALTLTPVAFSVGDTDVTPGARSATVENVKLVVPASASAVASVSTTLAGDHGFREREDDIARHCDGVRAVGGVAAGQLRRIVDRSTECLAVVAGAHRCRGRPVPAESRIGAAWAAAKLKRCAFNRRAGFRDADVDGRHAAGGTT